MRTNAEMDVRTNDKKGFCCCCYCCCSCFYCCCICPLLLTVVDVVAAGNLSCIRHSCLKRNINSELASLPFFSCQIWEALGHSKYSQFVFIRATVPYGSACLFRSLSVFLSVSLRRCLFLSLFQSLIQSFYIFVSSSLPLLVCPVSFFCL